MKLAPVPPLSLEQQLARAERRAAREKAARIKAESIAEEGLRRLYEGQQRLLLLQRITDGANRATRIEDALRVAITEVCKSMDWAFGNAYLAAADQSEVTGCDVWYASDPDSLFPFVDVSRKICFRRGIGLPGRILADVRPHWVDDVTVDPNFPRAPVAARCRLSSACAFPIMVGEQVAGVLEFFSLTHIIPDEYLLGTMGQIGTQIGRVIEREQARRALVHDALHDAMTGLPNRTLFRERANAAFAALQDEPGRRMALLVVDLDGFKAINDTVGHQAGDSLLIDVAQRMNACLREREVRARAWGGAWRATLARVGGDEFNILIDNVASEQTVRDVADAIHACLATDEPVTKPQMRCKASIGIAFSHSNYREVDQILRDADLALYKAKAHGRGRTMVFTEELGVATRQRTQLEQELRQAIAEHQFVLHYQVIVNMNAPDRPAGFEALLRWQHPKRGLLAPGEFIDVAEDSGLILFIGDRVLRQACAQAAAWHEQTREGPKPFVSINISPQQFLQPQFVSRVKAVLIETGVEPSAVRLEVTEGVAVQDPRQTASVLNEIRSWGVKASLDDFGTGFSSLSYLQTMPFDTIKIDRSFVRAIARDIKSHGIIRAILDLARTMNMSVVAEGIECPRQQDALRELGCEMGQGFHYGKAEPEATAFARLQQPAIKAPKRARWRI